MRSKKLSDIDRAAIVLAYSESFFNLTQEGQGAPADVMMMLMHRLRSALRDGPCADCPNCALHAALEESAAATDAASPPSTESKP